MQRRTFLQTTGSAIAGLNLLTTSLTADTVNLTPARRVLSMNQNWRYSPRVVEKFETLQFDDSGFESVIVPHTNIRLPWHGFDEKAFQFVSSYRRKFKVPSDAKGRRVFVDFEGVMTASRVWINGHDLGEYKGGYTPFSFELTSYLNYDGENLLAVQVDSTERADIPPFGNEIDYLTFGGIYREVSLRIVSATYLENIFAQPKDVLTDNRSVDVACYLHHSGRASGILRLEVELRDGETVIAKAESRVPTASAASPDARHVVTLRNLTGVHLWDLEHPYLYSVHVRLLYGAALVDEDSRRIGFRDASFTDHGFQLNGKIVKIRGLNRHQTFPFMGQAMPKRAQRRDAQILKNKLKCNLVRTSHYPQSRHFLDCCDEIGLLVLEEIPGWQHIGDESWKKISIDNVGRMIRRDWNHPSIILWGVRINESQDDHEFYTRTNTVAHELDSTRQRGGIRFFQESEFLEDVFTMNDFGFPLKAPNHPRYLNTEFVGHTYPTKTIDDVERLREHTLRHARIHNQLASNPQYSGGIGWCAFDYNTHSNFGSGDHICYHGVTDIFREPKLAAGFYRSQCDPAEEVILDPAFHWARGDESIGFTNAVVCTNCDHLKFYLGKNGQFQPIAEVEPDRKEFQYLPYPPFSVDLSKFTNDSWGDLKIEGYIKGKQVIAKTLSGRGIDQKLELIPDDTELLADGSDSTRIVFRITDEYGAIRPFATDAIQFTLQGPAELIGDNPFSPVGGTGAVWIRASQTPGTVQLIAKHPYLGTQQIQIRIAQASADVV